MFFAQWANILLETTLGPIIGIIYAYSLFKCYKYKKISFQINSAILFVAVSVNEYFYNAI